MQVAVAAMAAVGVAAVAAVAAVVAVVAVAGLRASGMGRGCASLCLPLEVERLKSLRRAWLARSKVCVVSRCGAAVTLGGTSATPGGALALRASTLARGRKCLRRRCAPRGKQRDRVEPHRARLLHLPYHQHRRLYHRLSRICAPSLQRALALGVRAVSLRQSRSPCAGNRTRLPWLLRTLLPRPHAPELGLPEGQADMRKGPCGGAVQGGAALLAVQAVGAPCGQHSSPGKRCHAVSRVRAQARVTVTATPRWVR